MVKVDQITAAGTHTLLEGPHWDEATQSLYYIDIFESTIFRYVYCENKTYHAKIDALLTTKLGFIVPVEDKPDQFIVGAGPQLVIIQWDGKSTIAKQVGIYSQVEADIKITRFNDGKVDPKGRVFAGTLRSEEHGDVFGARIGNFYRFENGTPTKLRGNISVSNGLAWDERRNKFYYIDSADFDIKEFDYDPSSGTISNEKVLIDFKQKSDKLSFAPDGMTIDSNGMLYVALFNGGKVLQIDPALKVIKREILIPGVQQVTSVIFGGPELDELFVTTASLDKKGPAAGGLFRITGLGVTGLIGHRAKLGK